MNPSFTPQHVVYLRLRKRVRIKKGYAIRLKDIAQMVCPPDIGSRLAEIVIYHPNDFDGNLVLIDMLQIIHKIHELLPGLAVEHYGEPHVLVEMFKKEPKANIVWIVMVWLLLFIGSGLAIMNFHADVSMLRVHHRIFELITGRPLKYPLIFEIPYSLGIGFGMVVFFNHLFKKKFNEEPSPLEVEMFLYQENVNHYVVTEEYAKLKNEAERQKERP